jgi:hypothetical protein
MSESSVSFFNESVYSLFSTLWWNTNVVQGNFRRDQGNFRRGNNWEPNLKVFRKQWASEVIMFVLCIQFSVITASGKCRAAYIQVQVKKRRCGCLCLVSDFSTSSYYEVVVYLWTRLPVEFYKDFYRRLGVIDVFYVAVLAKPEHKTT